MAVMSKLKDSVPFSLPKVIWGVGLVTLLLNFSTIIIFSLSPLYLTEVFGISCLKLGVLEGVVEFCALSTRIFAGVISDAIRKRKPLLLGAVSLTAIARPIFPLAPTISWIYVSRTLDRIANGLQATPREALIGDYAPVGMKGACYGLRESLGKLGSFFGAGLTMLWLYFGVTSYHPIFWFASIPPLIAVLLVTFLIKDPPFLNAQASHSSTPIFTFDNVKKLKKDYWIVILISFLFTLSTYSGAFMILQAKHVSGSDAIAPLVMISQNISATLAAYPIGRLFDIYNHRLILSIGFMIVIIANMCLAFAPNAFVVLLGAFFWGIQMAWTQSLLVAKVASNCDRNNRGTAFSIYYLFVGIAFLLCNMIVGKLSDLFSLQAGFFYSSIIAALAFFFLPLIKNSQEE